MGRPIATDYQHARKLLTGALDPTGLGLAFEHDGNRVFANVDATPALCGKAKLVHAGLAQAISDDLAHATLAVLKRKVAVTRESRLRFVKPLYVGDVFRCDGTLLRDATELSVVQVRFFNRKEQLCMDGELELFYLTSEQIRRMMPDGSVPAELRRLV
jgi:acyl-coenzyme A thioesterase PaaI-like protein